MSSVAPDVVVAPDAVVAVLTEPSSPPSVDVEVALADADEPSVVDAEDVVVVVVALADDADADDAEDIPDVDDDDSPPTSPLSSDSLPAESSPTCPVNTQPPSTKHEPANHPIHPAVFIALPTPNRSISTPATIR